jgi:acyl phosphate:glycerol-3-phosphate acyltransferase
MKLLRGRLARLCYDELSVLAGYRHVNAIWIAPATALLLGYLLGSIPFGIVLTRLAGAGDLRAVGSGNIGATNVLRTGRKGLAAATLLLDGAKGAAAVLLAQYIGPDYGVLGAAAAFFGHCYPFWLRFKGGKGVATYAGIALALLWPVGLVYAAVWLGVLAISRYSSLSGILAALAAPVAAAWWGAIDVAVLFIALTLIVLWKHRDNITRLLGGTEPRVGQKA